MEEEEKKKKEEEEKKKNEEEDKKLEEEKKDEEEKPEEEKPKEVKPEEEKPKEEKPEIVSITETTEEKPTGEVVKEVTITEEKPTGEVVKETTITYFKSQNNNENPQLEIPSMNSTTSNAYNGLNEDSISMANISPSIERLQSLIPDINEKMTIKNSFNIYTPPNLYKLNYEKYLKSMLKELNQREKEAKKK